MYTANCRDRPGCMTQDHEVWLTHHHRIVAGVIPRSGATRDLYASRSLASLGMTALARRYARHDSVTLGVTGCCQPRSSPRSRAPEHPPVQQYDRSHEAENA